MGGVLKRAMAMQTAVVDSVSDVLTLQAAQIKPASEVATTLTTQYTVC